MTTRQDYIETATEMIGELASKAGSLSTFVTLAAQKVNRVRPRIVRLVITGDGGDEYGLGSDWVDRFSRVAESEGGIAYLDANDSDDYPRVLRSDEWKLEYDSNGDPQIRFAFTFDSSDRMHVFHTAPHTIDDSGSTLRTVDDTPFAELVAALAIRFRIAAVLAMRPQSVDADRTAVDVAHAEALQQLERTLRRSAYAHFGIRDTADDGEPSAVASSASASIRRSLRGATRLSYHTHRNG